MPTLDTFPGPATAAALGDYGPHCVAIAEAFPDAEQMLRNGRTGDPGTSYLAGS